jgi:hypothetical protein
MLEEQRSRLILNHAIDGLKAELDQQRRDQERGLPSRPHVVDFHMNQIRRLLGNKLVPLTQ